MESFIFQEPTSGLDSHSAQALISRLKKYAEQEGKSIVVTVHQPSSRMFHSFSKLLLLSNGQVAYYGSTANVGRFFSTIGLTLLPHYNPADFIRECTLLIWTLLDYSASDIYTHTHTYRCNLYFLASLFFSRDVSNL